MQLGIEHGVLAVICTTVGGIVTKWLSFREKREEMELDEASSIRKELREDVAMLKNQIDKLNEDLDHWKVQYFKLSEENLRMKEELADLRLRVSKYETPNRVLN